MVRTDLVERLVGSNSMRVVLILAGPGYGKSTLLAQWAAADDRPFAWLSMSPQLRDPVVLLAEIADALHSVESLDPEARARLVSPDVDYTSVRLTRLAQVVASRSTPFVLVVDDAHLLSSRQALDALSGSRHVGARRIADRDRIARGPWHQRWWPARERRLLTIDAESLAMNDQESARLLRKSGLDLSEDDVSLLVERTEGWPVALYLTALALRQGDDPAASAHAFAGDDRYVVDYLRDELFGARCPTRPTSSSPVRRCSTSCPGLFATSYSIGQAPPGCCRHSKRRTCS